MTGDASINGTGVLIYNAGSNYPNPDGRFGGITLSGDGTFSLTAAATGTYAGVAIYQARSNTRAVNLSGNASAGITGVIYAKNAKLTMGGNADLRAPLVVGMLQLSGDAGLTKLAGSDGAGDTFGVPGTLLAGDLSVYVNDPNGYFTADELARIQDTIGGLNALLLPYSVTITEVSDPTLANLVIDMGTTSACGTAAEGVLGCYNGAGSEITILEGWNWYAGADPTQIRANQYDFQTTVTHEFGHALGLGGADDPTSPMYETLAMGTASRTMTVADLNIPEPPTLADPLTAAGFQSHGKNVSQDTAASPLVPKLNFGNETLPGAARSSQPEWPLAQDERGSRTTGSALESTADELRSGASPGGTSSSTLYFRAALGARIEPGQGAAAGTWLEAGTSPGDTVFARFVNSSSPTTDGAGASLSPGKVADRSVGNDRARQRPFSALAAKNDAAGSQSRLPQDALRIEHAIAAASYAAAPPALLVLAVSLTAGQVAQADRHRDLDRLFAALHGLSAALPVMDRDLRS